MGPLTASHPRSPAVSASTSFRRRHPNMVAFFILRSQSTTYHLPHIVCGVTEQWPYHMLILVHQVHNHR